MKFSWFFLLVLAYSCVWFLTGHFGFPSPYQLGLLSGVIVSLTVAILVIVTAVYSANFFSLLLALITASLWLITVTNWWHYSFFSAFYNYDFVKFGLDSTDALKSLATFQYKIPSLLLLLTLSILSVGIIKTRPAQVESKIFGPILLILIIAVFFAVKTHIQSIHFYQRQNMVMLNPSLLHPVQAFFFKTTSLQISDEAGVEAAEYFRALRSKGISRAPSVALDTNVIVITLESFRADMTGFWGGTSLTPNLDSFAKNNVSISNFYANTNYTVKGETAVWCGIFDHSVKPPISKYSQDVSNLNCLPKLLHDRFGYKTKYFHANNGDFYSRSSFLPIVGFEDSFFFADEFPEMHQTEKLGWGVSDGLMFEFMLSDLETGAKPFFASFMTISSHYPFQWDWDLIVPNDIDKNLAKDLKLTRAYENAISYVDQQLGLFLSRFYASSLADNTILIITGDHGVWVFPDETINDGDFVLNERFVRLPFALYIPEASEFNKEMDIVASQIDIFPTLAALMNIDVSALGLVGQDIFSIEKGSGYSISMRSGSASVRVADTICYSPNSQCSGVHQNCASWNPQDVVTDDGRSTSDCYKYLDDSLESLSMVPVESSESSVVQAMSLIAYQNKKVFSGKAVRLDEADESPGQQVHH